jgi:UDP-N-acetyl-D-mannosaminuronic acid dehydrogenase
MSLAGLRARVEDGSAAIGVVGLGYVGLPVACLFAATGLRVTGVDINADRVRTINGGQSPITGEEPGLSALLAQVVREQRLLATTDHGKLAAADVVVVCVETPVDDRDHRPRYQALRLACRTIGAVMRTGALVIIESTIAPGTIRDVAIPELTAGSGRPHGDGFFVGHCPERVMPGRLLRNLREMSRVVGGDTPEVAETMAALYRRFVEGDLDLTDPLTAELVKTAENAYRDVNIAFANQVGLICEAVGGDVWTVRELVNKSPGRLMLMPGGGVGGHCIPKDPWLLAAGLPEGEEAPLISAARAINEQMPRHVAALIEELLTAEGLAIAEATIAILGYAYLEDSDDTRHSPSAALLDILAPLGCPVRLHDPYVHGHDRPLAEVLSGADLAVVMVAHSAYRKVDLTTLAGCLRRPLMVDARRVFTASALQAAGLRFRTLGVAGAPHPAVEAGS